ncbi:MAG: putative LPS assembly protein LptD [Candidatus Cryptobacteroides sp.]|nr:putative LPS assembly protein LptD [Candidatus Cryptobacteroides sp.]
MALTGLTMFGQDVRRNRNLAKAAVSHDVSQSEEAVVIDTAISPQRPEGIDTLRTGLDSTAFRRDSLRRADSTSRADSLSLLEKSSLTRPAFSGAKDSIRQDFSNGQRKMYYWGEVEVSYENIKLKADYMEYDMATGTVYARGTYDSLSREWKGQPEMTQGKQTFSMEEIRYNFNTRKARITNMITREDDGILHGKNIKMMPDRSINITKGKYTVCDLEHPHYYLKLSSAKVVTKPSQKTVFGPAHLVVEDVDLPIGIPFGFIPKRPDRATGLLMPSFGEENARGFYLRDAGMYFVLGDYFDMSLTGDYYTLGSWAANLNSRYMVKYKFNGNLAINYSVDQTGEKGSTDFFQSKNFGVRWSHSQDSKAHPGTSFSASVNFSSPSNSRYNSHSVSEALQNQISSSISYSKNWNGKFNLSVNALHSQNSRDSSYSFTLPNITFSVSTFYPFKIKNRVGKERIYEKFALGYNTSLQNKINFKASEFGEPGFLDKFQNGMTHNFSIKLPDFTLLKYLNVAPSVSYGMNWFFRKSEAYFDRETNSVKMEMGKQFGHFGTTHNYSGSVSMSTRLYGMYDFGKFHKVQAVRHVISPSVSMSFSPEKGKAFNGWRTLNYVDTLGVQKSYDYNIYQGQINSAPGKGKSATMSLSIGNNLEAKVRDMKDTTGTGTKKVKILDQLNLTTGYNFLADSLKMNNVGVSMSTSVFGKLGINGNMNFDPYAIDGKGKRINRYNILETGVPLRLTNVSGSLSYSLSGKGTVKGNDGSKSGGGDSGNAADYYRRIYYHPITGEYIPGGWLYYTNPNVPWSVNFNYNFSMNRTYEFINDQLRKKDNYTQTLGVQGNIQLTPKMSVQAQSGWDFTAMKMTTTQFSFRYDLHCFNISVSWVPSGMYQSYSFLISANAAALADLLRFKKSTSYWDK